MCPRPETHAGRQGSALRSGGWRGFGIFLNSITLKVQRMAVLQISSCGGRVNKWPPWRPWGLIWDVRCPSEILRPAPKRRGAAPHSWTMTLTGSGGRSRGLAGAPDQLQDWLSRGQPGFRPQRVLDCEVEGCTERPVPPAQPPQGRGLLPRAPSAPVQAVQDTGVQ